MNYLDKGWMDYLDKGINFWLQMVQLQPNSSLQPPLQSSLSFRLGNFQEKAEQSFPACYIMSIYHMGQFLQGGKNGRFASLFF